MNESIFLRVQFVAFVAEELAFKIFSLKPTATYAIDLREKHANLFITIALSFHKNMPNTEAYRTHERGPLLFIILQFIYEEFVCAHSQSIYILYICIYRYVKALVGKANGIHAQHCININAMYM